MDNLQKTDDEKKLDIINAMNIVGPESHSTQSDSQSETQSEEEEEDDDSLEEEYVRLMTKDGVEYIINAPLPPSKGFVINDDGLPIIWNAITLKMEPYIPEDVTIKKISLFQLRESEDVFRIFCLGNENSEYKQAGLSIVRTIPFSEVSSWDTVVNESMLVSEVDINEGEGG